MKSDVLLGGFGRFGNNLSARWSVIEAGEKLAIMKNMIRLWLLVSLALASLAIAQQSFEPPKPGSSKYGRDDQRGAANILTAAKVLEATKLIKTGKVYQLGRVLEEGMPLVAHRHFTVIMHVPSPPAGKNRVSSNEEALISEIGQVGTQLDGLGHVGVGDIFYNGNNRHDFQTGNGLTKLGIENAGVFITRGLLLDLAILKGVGHLEKGYEITAADLKQALQREKLEIRPGDAVLIHTGWGSLWEVDNDLYDSGEPGLGIGAADFLVEQQISLVGADTWATEVVPNPDPNLSFPVHQILLTQNGIYNLEIVDTSELARDGVYEFEFILTPLRLKGFTGSPANPIAVR